MARQRQSARFLPGLFSYALTSLPSYLTQSVRWARQAATSLKAGQAILLRDKLFTIVKATHAQGTARQVGNVQLELRDLRTQLKHVERLRSSTDVEVVFLAYEKWSVLYREGDTITCLHPESYDQISLPLKLFGAHGVYVCEGIEITVESYKEEPVTASVPVIVEIGVASVDANAYDGLRQATLSNGHIMKLPAYVRSGDIVAINTKEAAFVKRLRT